MYHRPILLAIPLMLLPLTFTFINNNLLSATEGSSFAFMTNYLSNILMYLSWGALAAAAIVWLATWISDYWTGYLPNWIRRSNAGECSELSLF